LPLWRTACLLGADVRGLAATVLVPVLDERLALVERLAAAGRIDPADVPYVRATFDAIRTAHREWLAWRQDQAAADGSVAATVTAIGGALPHEIDTTTAAGMLGVTANRVRQLARAGLLDGRRAGRQWAVSRESVETYRRLRGDAA
jgi:hypothetical protein